MGTTFPAFTSLPRAPSPWLPEKPQKGEASLADTHRQESRGARCWRMVLSEIADGGPWPCEETGCPNTSVSCALLAKEGACAHPFASIWERAPPSIASLKVWEGCPASCSAHGAPKRMYRQNDASFVQFSEHMRGACLAASGKPMDRSSGRVIHGWFAWVALRASRAATRTSLPPELRFDATRMCADQCAASGPLLQECLNNCAHGFGHGLFHAALDGSDAFNCSQLFEHPDRLPELNALDTWLRDCPRNLPYQCESGFLHSYFASVQKLSALSGRGTTRVKCPLASRAHSMCVISQHQFAPMSADGRCSAAGSVCAFACHLGRSSLWKAWQQSEFQRLPCNGTQLAACTAAAVYVRFLDRVIHMRQFCDDPVARAMLARLAPHMVCTSDLSLLLSVLLRSRPELNGSEVCDAGPSLAVAPAVNMDQPDPRTTILRR